MDILRGNFADGASHDSDPYAYDPAEDNIGAEVPPPAIGQDERRMQVRAYNHWASTLKERRYPSIEDLDPENLPDFGPYSVLLDFTAGVENPGVTYLGRKLASQCGADDTDIELLSDVPSRSLLSRITDHYMQILANQAPIGFEAEFVNQQDETILYRGILLPYSSDDDTIDFIYGVINWKELADQRTTDELLLEIDQVLAEDATRVAQRHEEEMSDWADGPLGEDVDEEDEAEEDDVYDLGALIRAGMPVNRRPMPQPTFGMFEEDPVAPDAGSQEADSEDMVESEAARIALPHAPYDDGQHGEQGSAVPRPAIPVAYEPEDAEAEAYEVAIEYSEVESEAMGLGDWLASARQAAQMAVSSEDRGRQALYAAIGLAYDFSLAAADAPEEFAELLVDAGIAKQDRAPMTPVVKLVFGVAYDKTRLTEFAAALSHAHRLELEQGTLASFIGTQQGGLKAVVAAERKLRREESGKRAPDPRAKAEKIAVKLRGIAMKPITAIDDEGSEFALVMIRRLDNGGIALVGEVPQDAALLESAARKLSA